jgi:chromosome segregation ATPase
MSNYNTLLNHIEYKLGNTTNLNTNSDSNFYETQIKKNLPYFQNQRIKNLEKEISNGNNLYSTSYNLNSNFANKTYGSGNLNIETFDTKNRKSMEREMEPYLNKMKSELNFLMENFRNEIGNCSNIQPQLNSLEEKIEDNKKMINIYQEDNIKKISSFENKINFLNLEIEKLNNKFTDMNKKVLEFQEVDYKIKEMTFQVNDIQTKANNYDMTNADLYNKIQEQLLKVIENQLNNFNNEFQNLKNRNEDFNKKVFDLDQKYNNVHNMNLNIHNENIENKKELSNLQIENSNLKILFSNGIKQIESVTDNYNDLKNEINTNYKSKMNKLNEEIAENQMYFKNIGEDLKKEIQIINELNEKLLNSHSQISLLKDQIIQIDLS